MKKLLFTFIALCSIGFSAYAQDNIRITEQQAIEIANEHLIERGNCVNACIGNVAIFDDSKGTWFMVFSPQLPDGSSLSTTLSIYVSADGKTINVKGI